MTRAHRFHLDVAGHSVTVLTRHATRETELLVDGKTVGYQRTPAGHRRHTVALAAELPGDPPQPFDVTLRAGDAAGHTATCVLEIAGRRYPMPDSPLGGADRTRLRGPARPLRRMRRLLRRSLR
ncbi:hypothetical protein ACWD00_24835 [Streptomyces viridiviolaceus]